MILKTTFQAKDLKESLNEEKEGGEEPIQEEDYEENLLNLRKELENTLRNTVEGSGKWHNYSDL
jgi:hypothetical protein